MPFPAPGGPISIILSPDIISVSEGEQNLTPTTQEFGLRSKGRIMRTREARGRVHCDFWPFAEFHHSVSEIQRCGNRSRSPEEEELLR